MFDMLQKPEKRYYEEEPVKKKSEPMQAKGKEMHSYGTGALGYTREEEPGIDVVQRKFILLSDCEHSEGDLDLWKDVVYDYDKFVDRYKAEIAALALACRDDEKNYDEEIMAIIEQLIVEKKPPDLIMNHGDYGFVIDPWSLLERDTYSGEFWDEAKDEDADSFIRYMGVGFFEDIDAFLEYVQEKLITQIEEQENTSADAASVTPDTLPESVSAPKLKGAHMRFSTIYSYAKVQGQQKVDATQQGPHTLAHVSVSYLMDNAPQGYNFRQQILNMDEVVNILTNLGQLPADEDAKVYTYLQDYQDKLNELDAMLAKVDHIITKPNALIRELMEMHPMAVYSWRSNMKRSRYSKTVGAGKENRKSHGETYGSDIYLDNGWRPIGITEDALPSTVEWQEMRNYLLKRLSMVVPPEKLEVAVADLMKNGVCNVQAYR